MMLWVVLILSVLALWHFIYDGILAPSFRLSIRYRLFALRDELREMKHSKGEGLDSYTFALLHDYVNTAIDILPALSPSLVAEVERSLRSDPQLRKVIEARLTALDRCPYEEVQDIRRKAKVAAQHAFLVNTGGWFIWLVPYLVARHVLDRIANLVVVPIQDIMRLAPESFHPSPPMSTSSA